MNKQGVTKGMISKTKTKKSLLLKHSVYHARAVSNNILISSLPAFLKLTKANILEQVSGCPKNVSKNPTEADYAS